MIGLARELAKAWPDSYIAGILNRLGHHTGPGNGWNETRIKNLRLYHKIPVFAKGVERPWLTMSEAAKELTVGVAVIRTMIEHGLLPAKQPAKGTPWLIQREDLQKAEVQDYARNAHIGKSAPRVADNQTLIPCL